MPPQGILNLLCAATAQTAEAYAGHPGKAEVLHAAACHAQLTVRHQAETGDWREWLADGDLTGLICFLEVQATLCIGRRPGAVGIWWDFTNTKLAHLGKVFTSEVP